MKNKLISAAALSTVALLVMATSAFAHVIVKPNQTGIGESQTFTIEVPAEKDNPTVAVKLLLPNNLQTVNPVVNSGWTITIKKNGASNDAPVTEIDWTGGSIPAGQMEIFSFRAQVPAKETTLQWKAYQTYQDGSVVSWDQTPNGSDDATGDKGPYSETKVVNDLTGSSSTSDQTATWVSYGALVLSVIALGVSVMKSKTK